MDQLLAFATDEVDRSKVSIELPGQSVERAGNYLLLKGYQLMLEQLTKAGATVTTGYSGVTFARKATAKEAEDQLKSKQSTWDHLKKLYDQFAAVGELEHSYMESSVKSWAAQEGLPYPPPHEPISSFDAVIRGIEEVVSE